MDDQRKDRPGPKRLLKRKDPQRLQAHKLPTDDMENTNGTNKGGNLLFAKLQTVLSTLLFVIEMMPHNLILRKCTDGYKLYKSQEKINHLMYMDDVKLFAESEKEM